MPIPTTRAKNDAEIRINHTLCTGCGLCISVCKDNSIEIKEGKATTTGKSFFGCIACGHCMAICPTGAIEIYGRELSPNDVFELKGKVSPDIYDDLLRLLQGRRSVREFKPQPVSSELTAKILEMAATAPMGLPPSDVHVVVFDSADKVTAFTRDFCTVLEGMKWFVSNWFLTLMRPFWGKQNDEMFRQFIKPVFHLYTGGMKEGKNWVTYDAPLMFYFYGSPYTDPADPIVAATYAMHAAEALGLGTCMLGAIHPLIQYGKASRKLREKYGIRYKSREGLFLIVGHPAVKYHKGLRRTFVEVHMV